MSTTTTETWRARPDGPHSDYYTILTARTLAETVRVLNRASMGIGVDDPATVYDVVGEAATAAHRLGELFTLLGTYVSVEHAAGRVDAHGDGTLTELGRLFETARGRASLLGQALDALHAASGRLFAVEPTGSDALDGGEH